MSDQAVTKTMQEALAQQLEALEGPLAQPLTNKIATSGKLFTLPTGESHPGPLRAVILDFVWFLAHYPDGWNPDDPGEPDCWAIGRDTPESGYLVPHHEVRTPYAESCASCPVSSCTAGRHEYDDACDPLCVPHSLAAVRPLRKGARAPSWVVAGPSDHRN